MLGATACKLWALQSLLLLLLLNTVSILCVCLLHMQKVMLSFFAAAANARTLPNGFVSAVIAEKTKGEKIGCTLQATWQGRLHKCGD